MKLLNNPRDKDFNRYYNILKPNTKYIEKREINAVLKIQSLWKKYYKVRREVIQKRRKLENEKAKLIQRIYRGFHVRITLKRIKEQSKYLFLIFVYLL